MVFGDAAAALVGKVLGRNPIIHPWVDGVKTKEGTIAMYSVSATSMLLCLMISIPFATAIPIFSLMILFSFMGV